MIMNEACFWVEGYILWLSLATPYLYCRLRPIYIKVYSNDIKNRHHVIWKQVIISSVYRNNVVVVYCIDFIC